METSPATTEFDSYLYNMKAMNQIVREMKEIPELPSETPKDVTELERVEFPEGGGVLTYMSGHPFPYQGFPLGDFVDKIDIIKKIARSAMSGFYHRMKSHNILLLVTLLPSVWVFKDILYSSLYTFYRMIERFRVKPLRYSKSVRELHRAMSIGVPGENALTGIVRSQIRDLLCMFLEFDNAYRFRMQHVLSFLDKVSLAKNPRKEMLRLLAIMSANEMTQEIRDSWKLVSYAVKYYLFFDREFLSILKGSLLELNLSEIALSEGDTHYCEKRKDYNFGQIIKTI